MDNLKVIVLISCEKELGIDILNLIMNQFNNLIQCGLNEGNNSTNRHLN